MKLADFLPLLHICIEVPLITVRTELMGERLDMQEREYIALFIRIWKWRFQIVLYDTYRRIYQRRRKTEAGP